MSKHINLENESVANVFFGTLETPFSTKCNVRPLMRVLLIFFKFNFSFEGGGGANHFFFYGDHFKIDDHQKATFWKK